MSATDVGPSRLRDALDRALHEVPGLPDSARAAYTRLTDVLEAEGDAVILPAGATLTTSEAAALLGISRMTVVRLVERGQLRADRGAVHRRIHVNELLRYQAEARDRRRARMTDLASDITAATPGDQIVSTR